ncbi:peroxisomal membrane protein PEX16-like [Patiria miniata]|uniref:Peroxisomal membrane protein PEX16 n=1 Tax=Patiria miniata TaxID=46514 RepID=A0A914BJK1_PATMI|nr:peroxisomal membrane protein PEX16-like [Patiria miniata]
MEASSSTVCKTWEVFFERYKQTWKWYENWVSENPEVVSQIEKSFRVFSYLLPGAVNVDTVVAELVFSLSNLLVLFHDGILRKARGFTASTLTISAQRLMRWLTVIDHTEVFVELAAAKCWGEAGRWFFIALIQILRSIFRLILLLKCKAGVRSQPPLQPLNRDTDVKPCTTQAQGGEEDPPETAERLVSDAAVRDSGATFRGERSGRVVRSLDAAPNIHQRTWRLPRSEEQDEKESTPPEKEEPTELMGFPLAGESLQIARPLLHLTALLVWGQQSWKPWLLSLAADIGSLRLLNTGKRYNHSERTELSNRSTMLLIYLLRSPCYDRYTRSRLLAVLSSISNTVPGVRLIMNPLMEYLPIWQSIYFYNWGR